MAEQTVPAKTDKEQAMSTREEDRYLVPPVDIYETDKGLNVVCDLPGVSKDGIDLNIDDNVLTIQGKAEHKVLGDPVFREFELLNYYRQFHIGQDIDQSKINANMKHGVLSIELPKAEKAKPKKIDVKIDK